MSTLYIEKDLKDRCYFTTSTVIDWISIFTKDEYFQIIINSLKFFQDNISLKIFGYVIMPNHIHLISQCNDMISFIKNFKGFTTYQIKELLKKDKNFRLYNLFKDSKDNTKRKKFRTWSYKNWPILVESDYFFEQKLNYIHENPVKKGYVKKAEDWKYSSARNYLLDDHSVIRINVDKDLD